MRKAPSVLKLKIDLKEHKQSNNQQTKGSNKLCFIKINATDSVKANIEVANPFNCSTK